MLAELVLKNRSYRRFYQKHSVDLETLKDLVNLVLLVLALGKPREGVMIERVDASGNTGYWRDNEGVHHVPNRSLEDIIKGSRRKVLPRFGLTFGLGLS